jgi:hypothetical protein
MKPDTNTLCYQGIQRIYRNSVVNFIRSTLTNKFVDKTLENLKSPFTAEEWGRISQDAYTPIISGEINTHITDNFDILSVNHFFNIFDKFYDILFPNEVKVKNKDSNRNRTTILNWLKEIKNIRDPLSHPAEEAFEINDAFPILDSARRVLLRIGDVKSADELQNMIQIDLFHQTDLVNKIPIQIDDQLPPKETIVIDFIGREKQLQELWTWFSDPSSRRWALSGDGGKGKTAIAYFFATQVRDSPPPLYVTVLWLSAKRIKFTEGTIIETPYADFSNLDSALNSLLSQYGWNDETKQPTQTKAKKLLELFDAFPALVVVDDIDSLETTEEDAIEFFSLELPRTHSKVLFTSRRLLFGMGKTTTNITGFADFEGKQFINSRCQLLSIDCSQFSDDIIRKILMVTDASPLYIEDLLRLSASVKSIDTAIDEWENRGGQEARRYALGRECEMLSTHGRAILLASCFGEHPFSYTELQSITNLSDSSVTSGIQELQNLFLVPKPRFIDGQPRYEVNKNTRMLIRELYAGSEEYQRYRKAYGVIFKGMPADLRSEIAAIIRQAMLLIRSPRFEFLEAEHLLKSGIARYPSPDLHGVLGVVYKLWQPRRLTDAREQFKRSVQLKTKKEETFIHWLQMELDEDNWLNAIKVSESALLQFENDLYFLVSAAEANDRYAKSMRANLEHEKAKEHYEKSIEFGLRAINKPRYQLDSTDRKNLCNAYRCLVISFEALNDVKNINRYLNEWNQFCPENSDLQTETTRLCRKYHLLIE